MSVGTIEEDGQYINSQSYNITPCNEEKRFQVLALAQLELQEPRVPPEIAMLTDLTIVGVADSNISKSILDYLPSQLFQMTQLEILSISNSALIGTLPTEVGLMTSLSILDVSDNNLTGPLPSEVVIHVVPRCQQQCIH